MSIVNLGADAELPQREVDDAEGRVLLGVATLGPRDAGVVGGQGDGGPVAGVRSDGDEVVKREGLVQRGERVEAVRTGRADGEAEIDLREGTNARGHPGLIVAGRQSCFA